jgi:hypothetical protein
MANLNTLRRQNLTLTSIVATGNVAASNFVGNVTGTTNNVTLVSGLFSTVFDNTGVATFPGDVAVASGKTVKVNGNTAINGPAFSAYADVALQTITSGTQQKVLFQVEEFDTNNNYASSRFTPTVAGYYQLNSQVRLDGASGTGECMILLWKNGAEFRRGWNSQGVQFATNFWAMNLSTLVYANGTTDYFEIYVQQGSGSNVTVTAVNNPALTWFNGCMVRGA